MKYLASPRRRGRKVRLRFP